MLNCLINHITRQDIFTVYPDHVNYEKSVKMLIIASSIYDEHSVLEEYVK